VLLHIGRVFAVELRDSSRFLPRTEMRRVAGSLKIIKLLQGHKSLVSTKAERDLRPGGTPESSPAIYRRVRDHVGPASRRDARIPPRDQFQRYRSSKDPHDHPKAYTLVLPDRLNKTHKRGLCLGRWPAVHIKSPSVWNRDAFLVS